MLVAANYAALVAQTTAAYTVSAQVGPIETPLAPDWARFLLDRLDLAASIARARRIAPYEITRTAPGTYLADDHDGTKAVLAVVEAGERSRVFYAEGTQKFRMLPSVRAAAVILMSQEPVDQPGCPGHVRTTFTVYARLRSRLLGAVVKALRPLLRDAIARKFSRAFLVAHKVGLLLAEDPAPVAAELLRSPLLSPPERAAAERLAASLKPQPRACLAPVKP
jgi:hypothetical protein